MKRLIALVVAASLLMVLAAPVAAKPGKAQGNAYAYGHGDKVTGEIYWDRGTTMGTAWAKVSAHATKPSMGWFWYGDKLGSYTAKVMWVSISGDMARLAADITVSTYPGITTSQFVAIVIKDGGTPGKGVDKLGGSVHASLAAAQTAAATLAVTETAKEGNFKIHDRDK